MTHSEFIADIASIYKPQVYIELGAGYGSTFLLVEPHSKKTYWIDKVINCDMNTLYNSKPETDCIWFAGNTDYFFSENKKKGHIRNRITADMIFIDADHTYVSLYRDFMNSAEILNSGGIILIHDTDPEKESLKGKLDCGDAYRIIEKIENDYSDWNIVTLPIGAGGLSLCTRKGETRTQLRKKEPRK